MNETIPGWSSYKVHPGAVIPVDDLSVFQMIANAQLDAVSVGINRRFFQYESKPVTPIYTNTVSSGVENVLVWEPRIMILCLIGLAILVPIWLKGIL